MVGVGNGVLLMPVMLLVGVPMAQAVAVSLFVQTVPQTLPALLMKAPRPFPWAPSITVAIASMLGGILGALLTKNFQISDGTLKRMLAVTLVVFGCILWWGGKVV